MVKAKLTKRQIRKTEEVLAPVTNVAGSLQYLNEITEPFQGIAKVNDAKRILKKLVKDVSHEWMQAKNHYDSAKTYIFQAANELVVLGIPHERVSSLIKSVLTRDKMFSHTFISKALPEEFKMQYRIENAKKLSETRLASMRESIKESRQVQQQEPQTVDIVIRTELIHRTPREKDKTERMVTVVRHATREYREYWLPVIVRYKPRERDATVEFDVEAFKKHNEEFQRISTKG